MMRVTSVAELDALVGMHITRETPEIYWEDSHGCFRFATEPEARAALADPYYQHFLPQVDWARTVIREVRQFRPYSTDAAANWLLVEKAAGQFGPLLIWRERGLWHAAFGTNADVEARTPNVVICLAALAAARVAVEVHHDRLDAQIAALATRPPDSNGA